MSQSWYLLSKSISVDISFFISSVKGFYLDNTSIYSVCDQAERCLLILKIIDHLYFILSDYSVTSLWPYVGRSGLSVGLSYFHKRAKVKLSCSYRRIIPNFHFRFQFLGWWSPRSSSFLPSCSASSSCRFLCKWAF